MKIHGPYLDYHLDTYPEPPEPFLGGSVPIARTHAVHASLDGGTSLRVTVEGTLQKRDGTSALHRRHASVEDPDDPRHPDWFRRIVRDARARLKVKP